MVQIADLKKENPWAIYQKDPVNLIETYFRYWDVTNQSLMPVKLRHYQKDIVSSCVHYKKIAVWKGRKIGISWTAALIAVWKALSFPRSKIFLVAGRQSQSHDLLEFCRSFLKDSMIPVHITMDSENVTNIRFSNKSAITAMPTAYKAENIRGKDSDLTIVDECLVLASNVWGAIVPTVNARKGTLILITTGGTPDDFFHTQMKNPKFKTFTQPSTIFYSPEEMREFKQTFKYRPRDFESEYLCKHTASKNQIFADVVPRCLWPKYKGNQHPGRRKDLSFAGLDVGVATHGNPSSLVIVFWRQGKLWVRYCESKPGLELFQLVNWVKRSCKKYYVSSIMVDASGPGFTTADQLDKEANRGFDVHPVIWGAKSLEEGKNNKQTLYWNLFRLMSRGKVMIYQGLSTLIRELNEMECLRSQGRRGGKADEDSSGDRRYVFKALHSKDELDALAMAVWEASPSEETYPSASLIKVRFGRKGMAEPKNYIISNPFYDSMGGLKWES